MPVIMFDVLTNAISEMMPIIEMTMSSSIIEKPARSRGGSLVAWPLPRHALDRRARYGCIIMML